MLDKHDVEVFRGVMREEIRDGYQSNTFQEAVRGVLREEFQGEELRSVIREEFQSEGLRSIIREEVGDALEQIVLPRFDTVESRLDKVEGRLEKVESRLDKVDGRLGKVENRLEGFSTIYVTKEYLDDKLADFKTGLEDSSRWVAKQVARLTDTLHKGGVLNAEQVIEIRAQ